MIPWRMTWIPRPWAKIPSVFGLGGAFMTLSSTGSMPRAMAGRLSVTRLIQSSCMDSKGAALKSSMELNTRRTSPMLVPRRKPTVLRMLL